MAKHISAVTKEQVAAAILGKFEILEKWISEGIPWRTSGDGSFLRDTNGELQLDFFPKNVVQFGNWTSCQSTGLTTTEIELVIYTNRSTLYLSNKEKLVAIKNIFPKLAAKGAAQLKASNKFVAIGGLQQELEYYKKLCAVQENDITAGGLELSRLQIDLGKSNRALKNLTERYNDETRQLNKRNAELTSTLNKLLPLRKEGN